MLNQQSRRTPDASPHSGRPEQPTVPTADTRTRARRGVTILEVLFASGIAVFGLVGIASLIAVAGRQASDSNNWSEGQSAAQYALSDFVVRGYANSMLWLGFNDQMTGPVSAHFVPFNSIASPLMRQTRVVGNRTDNRHAFCIDPYFFADPTQSDPLSVGSMNITSAFPDIDISGLQQRYRPGLFPYYQDNYDPLNPVTPLTWNAGRLLRLSIQTPNGGLMPAKLVDRQFQFLEDLAVTTSEEDKSQAAERLFDGSLAQGLTSGQYSWFATLCPREFTSRIELPNNLSPENLFTLSVVVCKRRDRAFLVPAYDSQQPGPQAERVVSVTPPYDSATNTTIHFRGGGGGRVTLAATWNADDPFRDVSDSLHAGDWVMLCRESSLGGGHLMTICRWYRVLTLDVESNFTGSMWSRNVVLDGPDWEFDATYPTQATLVSGVVTVVERVIPVR